VLRLRGADGHPYLHLVEWQGRHDPIILWRTLGYLAWIGQNRPERPILVTLIYLTPEDDVGNTLVQVGTGQTGRQIHIPCVRLWQQDATAALAGGKPGLIALSPLMQGTTADLVEQAANLILDAVDPPAQAEVLTALGIFAEPLPATERFIRLVTRERLMASDVISYLMQDKVAEWEQKEAKLQEENAALHAQIQAAQHATVQARQHAIEGILIARFPDAPLAVMNDIRRITNPEWLQSLIGSLLGAATLKEACRLPATNGA